MGPVNPIGRDPIRSTPQSSQTSGASRSAATAAKVSQIVQLPVVKEKGLRGRQFTLLEDAKKLSAKIRGDWNLLAPEDLAEKIVEFENMVIRLEGTTPLTEKMKKQAEALHKKMEDYHFDFVFPLALETKQGIPLTFAKTVWQTADRVLKTNSLQAFNELNQKQQREVARYAGGAR